MNNIEVKVKIKDFKQVIDLLRKIKATKSELLRQKDTYFNCRSGKIKLRIINNKDINFIYYSRPDTAHSKISSYQIIEIDKKQYNTYAHFLHQALGTSAVVEKTRQLWLYGTTRIHLDKVKGLGKYLELETVIIKHNKQAISEHRKLISSLKLNRYQCVKVSYLDLMLAKKQ